MTDQTRKTTELYDLFINGELIPREQAAVRLTQHYAEQGWIHYKDGKITIYCKCSHEITLTGKDPLVRTFVCEGCGEAFPNDMQTRAD